MARISELSKRAYGRFHSLCRSAKARIRRPGNTKPVAQEPVPEPAAMPKPAAASPSPPPTRMTAGVGRTAGTSSPSSSRSSHSPSRPMAPGAGGTPGTSRPTSSQASSSSPPRTITSGIGASPSTPSSSLDETPLDKSDNIPNIAPVTGFRLPSRKAHLVMQAHRLGPEHGLPPSAMNFHSHLACRKLNTSISLRCTATIVTGALLLKLDVAKRPINPSFHAHLQLGVLDNMVPDVSVKFASGVGGCFSRRRAGADECVFIRYPASDVEVRAAVVTDPRTKVRDMRVTLWCNLGACESPIDQKRENNAGSYHDPSLLGDGRIISPEESLYMKHFDDTSPSKFGASGRKFVG
ncbi:hypothetical protein GX51_02523 [Blastomyces parvus]|uniref:Uncharacterized protein n=1 Tax=Blastomyces parvus TaxID=2060905 RepID=A0A2B7XAK7_9EURO|nr:hypothetical protein GX51_02523 [Blastomyces parvus]